jgi:hypothetical protein
VGNNIKSIEFSELNFLCHPHFTKLHKKTSASVRWKYATGQKPDYSIIQEALYYAGVLGESGAMRTAMRYLLLVK